MWQSDSASISGAYPGGVDLIFLASRADLNSSAASGRSLREVLDEADALLMSLGRYATEKQKSVRGQRPKEAAALLQKLCESRGPALQVRAGCAPPSDQFRERRDSFP